MSSTLLPAYRRRLYDLLRIGAWALAIVGAVLLVAGFIGYWAAKTGRSSGRP